MIVATTCKGVTSINNSAKAPSIILGLDMRAYPKREGEAESNVLFPALLGSSFLETPHKTLFVRRESTTALLVNKQQARGRTADEM